MAAAASESSSGLPGADDVGDAGGSAWRGTGFRSVESGARFLSDPRGERGLTLGRFGGGAEAEGEPGGGDVEEGRLAAELRRVSTIVSRSPEACRGFLLSSRLERKIFGFGFVRRKWMFFFCL